jgi:hypothetical protein
MMRSLVLRTSLALGVASTGFVGCSNATPRATGDGGPTDSEAIDFVPSNVDLSKVDFTGVEDVVISKDQTLRTDNGGLLGGTGNYTYRELTQVNGPKLGVFAVKSLTIESGATVTAVGADALVVVALDTIVIDGRLFGNSQTADGRIGPGAVDQNDAGNSAGSGAGGGSAGSDSTSAAGAGYCGTGGAGASSSGDPAQGGGMWGTEEIVPLVPGSNGGSGGVGAGGDGGGAIQLVAGISISVSGVVHVGGKGGWNAGVYDATGSLSQQASGGGSGGSILIEAPTVDIRGTLAANGGGGGGNVPGADATPDIQEADGGAGDEGHAPGGNGSSASGLNGEDGTSLQNATSGGGGGAAGRIRINSHPSQATIVAVLTPPLGPCATQGTF